MSVSTISTMTADVAIISALDNYPPDDPGMTPTLLKGKFDAGPVALKSYVNTTVVPGVNAGINALNAHTADTANPHGVTAAQVGAAATADLTAHTSNTSNPHGVTAAQIGVATTSVAGVMSAADKTKLNGIASGAQVNTVTSVNSKTGAVSLSASDVSALPIGGGTLTGALVAASASVGAFYSRNTYYSTSESASGGNDGDMWVTYTA